MSFIDVEARALSNKSNNELTAIPMEEVGMPVLTADINEDEDAIDPLLERLEARDKGEFPWQFVEEDFLSEQQSELLLKTKVEVVNYGCWSSVAGTATQYIQNPKLVPQGKGPARCATNPLEAWHLLLDEPILTIILKNTNEEIRRRRGKASYERTTDLLELRAWFGLNYLAGLFRNAEHAGPLDELWSLELGNAVFRATMSLRRYVYLASCLQVCRTGCTAQLSEVWKKFLINCRSYYAPSAYCTIGFSECSQSTLLLCDAKTLYLCNALQTDEQLNSNKAVLQLTCDIKGSERTLVTTASHTSVELAHQLQQHQLGLVGELAPHASHLPSGTQWLGTNQPALYSGNLILYPAGSGSLLTSGLIPTLNARQLYRASSTACQTLQRLVGRYSTRFATPETQQDVSRLRDCHTLLDYAAHNAWVLLRLSVVSDAELNAAMQQRDYLRQLGLYLTQQHLKRRLQRNENLSFSQKLLICEMLGEPIDQLLAQVSCKSQGATTTRSVGFPVLPDNVNIMSRISDRRQRCRKCKGANAPKTRSRCQQCLRNLCFRHLVQRCDDCTGVANLPTYAATTNEDET